MQQMGQMNQMMNEQYMQAMAHQQQMMMMQKQEWEHAQH